MYMREISRVSIIRAYHRAVATRRKKLQWECMKKEPKERVARFNFEELKAGAMNANPEIRKNTFIEYFGRFQEFPSYLFDNGMEIDPRLSQTIQDLTDDPETTETMRKGISTLLERLAVAQNVILPKIN